MYQKIKSITQQWRLPSVCAVCCQNHTGLFTVCSFCEQLLTPLGPACRYCRHPLVDSAFAVCGHCVKKRPDFDAVFTAYRFNSLLRCLLHDYKYRQALHLRSFLVKLMKAALPEHYRSDCLIPVPLHARRLRQRGFNQTAELAKRLAGELMIPYSLTHCHKRINTPTQAGLSGRQRRNNLKQSFTVKPMPYAHVTLVDDLLTTGSTASELARGLKQQGVQRVDVLCCARA